MNIATMRLIPSLTIELTRIGQQGQKNSEFYNILLICKYTNKFLQKDIHRYIQNKHTIYQ